jgi:hypothetical protein
MATGQAIDVDRRSLPLLLPERDATPWGINSAGPGQVESRLAREGIVHEGMGAGRRIQSMPAFDPKSFETAVKDATG